MSDACTHGKAMARPYTPPRRLARACWALPLLLAAQVAFACSASSPNGVSRHQHVVSGSIELQAGRYRVEGYDPADPRLLRVLNDLQTLYGRPIAVRFATSVMPRSQGFMENLFDSELGKLPQVMRAWQQSHTDAFSEMTAKLVHIDIDFDGALPAPTTEFDEGSGRLRFVLNSWTVPKELVARAMYSRHRRWQAQRFLDRPVEKIAPHERQAYLDALTQQGADYFFAASRPDVSDEPSGGRSEVILRTLRLAALAGDQDQALTQALSERLVDDGSYFRDCYLNHPKFLRDVAASSVWARAEQQWTQWAIDGLETLPFAARSKLLQILLVPALDSPRLQQHARAFPGFDVVRFGLGILDDWVKAGHVTAAGQGQPSSDPAVLFYDLLLCPPAADDRGFLRRHASNCRPTLWATALGDESKKQRLLDAIVGAQDERVRTLLTVNLIDATRFMPKGTVVPSILSLLRQTEPHRAQWRELVRLLAMEVDASTELREALYDLTTRYYRERPSDRGVLLFLLARIDGYGRTTIDWQRFGPTYGAPISGAELEVYLEQSYLAFEKVRVLLPALDARVSPGRVVAVRLRTYLDSPWAGKELQTRGRIMATLGSELVRIKDREGLESLREALRAYVGSDPGRERQLRDVDTELQSQILRSAS